ncbi:hypothetical protein FKM82_029774 [Ascaphus truei]
MDEAARRQVDSMKIPNAVPQFPKTNLVSLEHSCKHCMQPSNQYYTTYGVDYSAKIARRFNSVQYKQQW